MPERRSPHSDTDAIDRMQEDATPSQQSRAGGEVNRRVGTRDELARADGREDGLTRATGSDNRAQDESKGAKTSVEIQRQRNAS